MILTAAIETLQTATLIIFTLTSGGHREMISDDQACWMISGQFEAGRLYVDDTDLPKQKPVSIECKCTLVDPKELSSKWMIGE